MSAKPVFEFQGQLLAPGTRTTIDLPITKLYTHSPVCLPVHVLVGRKAGPAVFVSAAIHGDEINGVEIIRRLLLQRSLSRMHGVLLAIPVVNLHGFIHQSRYLPDRRDLNRSFPGSEKGSLAARLAYIFMHEIVAKCDYGIDLHTGAIHRANLPQIRANLDDPSTRRLAEAFGVPVLINADLRDGSLREAAASQGVPTLLYEGGEALRFDELAIRAGVRGVMNVLRDLTVLPPSKSKSTQSKSKVEPLVARSSNWVRTHTSGMFRAVARLGGRVKQGEVVGWVADPFSDKETPITAPFNGIVIGEHRLPLVNEGDAIFHIARFSESLVAERQVKDFEEVVGNDAAVGPAVE